MAVVATNAMSERKILNFIALSPNKKEN